MFSSDQLLLIYGVILGVCSFYSVKIIVNLYRKISQVAKNNKQFKQMQEKARRYKEEGNLHEWVTLPIKSDEGHTQASVCRNTGYCPKIEGYISLVQIEYMIKMKRQGELYEEFKKQQNKKIASKYGLSEEVINTLSDDIYNIKKEFRIRLMEESIKDMVGE